MTKLRYSLEENRSSRYSVDAMKPKDLKPAYSWADRKPLLQDKILYIPEYYDSHHLFGALHFSHASIFGNSYPISIEFCSGNGPWILEKACNEPTKNWIAVEKRFDRVRKIWSKMKNSQIENLLIVYGSAEDFINYYVDANTLDAIYINFPDPWPKEKHAKNRIVQKKFLDRLSITSKEGALSVFVTDDESYSLQMIEEIQSSEVWHPTFSSPYFITDWPNYGHSYFEQLFVGQGKQIRYIQSQNRKHKYEFNTASLH